MSTRAKATTATTRGLAAVLAAGCAAALAVGMLVQYGLGHPPCSLCVLQRLAFVVLFALACVTTFLPANAAPVRVVAVLALLAAVAGLGVAAYQVWIGVFPSEVARCGRGPAALFEDTPLESVANFVLDAAGDCGKPVQVIGPVTMPQLGLAGFLVALPLALRMVRLAFGARAR